VFASWLAPHFQRFVALKRAGGVAYATQDRILLAFDRYVAAQVPGPPLRPEAVLQYLASVSHLSPRARESVIGVVWPALAHAQRHEAPVASLPVRPRAPARSLRCRQLRIVTDAEIGALVGAARQLPGRLRPATVATLLGLLAVSGARIGEVLALDVGDLDVREQVLTIRKGKFGKTRVLPLRSSTIAALERYLHDPARTTGTAASAPLFVSQRRRRLSRTPLVQAFRCACRAAGLTAPLPSLHHLRHTFTVRCVATWYADGRDINAWLPALSTYLGHVSVENTRRYLVANGLLLEHAAARFAHATRALDEVWP
jgi:integrase